MSNGFEEEVSVEEIEQRPNFFNKPFGLLNDRWEEMKSKMLDGDKLIEFCSGTEAWASLCGRAGIMLVRGEEVIDIFYTMIG